MRPFGRYEFGSHGGRRSTLRAKGGQTFIVDVHALARHNCGQPVASRNRENWVPEEAGRQAGRQIAVCRVWMC